MTNTQTLILPGNLGTFKAASMISQASQLDPRSRVLVRFFAELCSTETAPPCRSVWGPPFISLKIRFSGHISACSGLESSVVVDWPGKDSGWWLRATWEFPLRSRCGWCSLLVPKVLVGAMAIWPHQKACQRGPGAPLRPKNKAEERFGGTALDDQPECQCRPIIQNNLA